MKRRATRGSAPRIASERFGALEAWIQVPQCLLHQRPHVTRRQFPNRKIQRIDRGADVAERFECIRESLDRRTRVQGVTAFGQPSRILVEIGKRWPALRRTRCSPGKSSVRHYALSTCPRSLSGLFSAAGRPGVSLCDLRSLDRLVASAARRESSEIRRIKALARSPAATAVSRA
jgi:hypothetical protein